MITRFTGFFAAFLVCLMCGGFVLMLPIAIELREQQFNKWSAVAPGPAVPAASLTSSPTPYSNSRLLFNANLNDGPGRGMKTASGSGRPLFVEAGND